MNITKQEQINQLKRDWFSNPRWEKIERSYTAEDVVNLRGSLNIEYTLAKVGSKKLWQLFQNGEMISSLGALTGNQAIQQVEAGLKAIYCSGWQVAADNNTYNAMFPDQSLYPVDSVPLLVKKINNSLLRTDQIHWLENKTEKDWIVPIIADGEAGFGGNLNVFELMKNMIIAGASGVHFEDQLSSVKKCGHLSGKVIIPTSEFINKLISARLSSDVLGVPTIIIARTDANAAGLLTSDIDERDHEFLTRERTNEGFYKVKSGIKQAIDRGLSYATYCDLIWCETSTPDLKEAKQFADSIHEKHHGKLLAYNLSPSFNWKKHLTENEMKNFRERLFDMGYQYQFITLCGWHCLNNSMFEISKDYLENGIYAYSQLQQKEIENEKYGYRGAKHQKFVGTSYFDEIQHVVTQKRSSILSMNGSTEIEQF